MNLPKVGRNDPCPCGSGKKYKNCHMNVSEESKKTYTPEGKRKFKAKVISLSEKSSEIFHRIPPAAAMAASNTEEGLKFKVTSKDFRVKPSEAKFQIENPSSEPKSQPPESAPHQPGDAFETTTEDFQVKDENQE